MPSNKDEMTKRMALAAPAHTVRGLVFNAVLKLIEKDLGKPAAEALRLPISKRGLVDFFTYPASEFVKLLFVASDLLEPKLGGTDAAIRACGAAAVSGFFDSGVGKTLISIVGRGDPKKLFSNAPTAYSTAVNYGVREYQALGDKQVRLQFHGDMQPIAFHEGLLAEALKAVGCEGTVTGTSSTLEVAEYLIAWK